MGCDTHGIHIVGIGADGVESLPIVTRRFIESAPVVCGSQRILSVYKAQGTQRTHAWGTPFADNLPLVNDLLQEYKTVVVLATGDGNWYGPSRLFIDYFGADKIALHPHVGAFQLATSYLKWHMQDCHFTTVHGRSVHTIKPHLYHGAKVLILSHDKHTVQMVAEILCHMGLGDSIIHTLNDLGTPQQSVQTYTASDIYETGFVAPSDIYETGFVTSSESDICETGFVAPSDLNTLAIYCKGITPSLTAGIADDLYTHDGQITKSPIRAITMAQLQPYARSVLWDFGAGSGSVSIEWARLGGVAHAFERTQTGCDIIMENMEKFGVMDKVTVHHTHIKGMPKNTDILPIPSAIFIGGGIRGIDLKACIDILPSGGRLVANTVTTTGESILLQTYETYGGDIQKISITKTARTVRFTRFAPLIPVTQYTYVKGDSP